MYLNNIIHPGNKEEFLTCQLSQQDIGDEELLFQKIADTYAHPHLLENRRYKIVSGEIDPKDQTVRLLFEQILEEQNPVDQMESGLLERPQAIQACAQKAFKQAQEIRYVWHGSRDYFFSTKGFSAKKLIADLLVHSKHNEGYFMKAWHRLFPSKDLVCDLGTGNGRFLLELEHAVLATEAFGVSAGQKLEEVNPAHFMRGDLDQFEHLSTPNRFFTVVSNLCFRHLVDPAKTLSQAYEWVQPGGFLIIDAFHFQGLKGRELEALHSYLKRAGYPIVAEYCFDSAGEKNGFNFLMIQKTHPHLSLPLHYRESPVNDRAVYQLDSRISREFTPPSFENIALTSIKKNGSESLQAAAFKYLAVTPGKRLTGWKSFLSELNPIPWTKEEIALVEKALQAEEIQHIIQARLNDQTLASFGISQ